MQQHLDQSLASGHKPKLLFGVGTPFSGTTSLLYTLSWTNDYCHNWKAQQHGFLQYMDFEWSATKQGHEISDTPEKELRKYKVWWPGSEHSIYENNWKLHAYRDFRKKVEYRTKRYRWHVDNPSNSKPPELVSNNPKVIGGKMIPSVEKEFMSQPFTIQKYVDYHLAHWENIKDNYQSLVDFNNSNGMLSQDFLNKNIPILQKYFDIKVVMIFRDPVKRIWSLRNYRKYNDIAGSDKDRRGCNVYSHTKNSGFRTERSTEKLESTDPTENWDYMNDGIEKVDGNSYKMTERNMIRYNRKEKRTPSDYTHLYKKFVEVVGKDNVHHIVMEKLFAGDKETKDSLSSFLGYKLGDIAKCVYVPDLGINPPKHQYLQDQWASDVLPLTDELAAGGRIACKKYYDDYAELFGGIPEEWLQ